MPRLVSHWKAVGRILRDRRCSRATAQVAYVILDRIGQVSGEAWPSFWRIAQDADVQLRTAKREVKRLCDLGYLVRRHGGNQRRSNRYMLADRAAETVAGLSPGTVSRGSPIGDTERAMMVTGRPPEPSQEPSISNQGVPAARFGRGALPTPAPRLATPVISFTGRWVEAFKARPNARLASLVDLIRELYEIHGEARTELLLGEAIKQEDPHSMLIHFLRGQPADGSSGDDRTPGNDSAENE